MQTNYDMDALQRQVHLLQTNAAIASESLRAVGEALTEDEQLYITRNRLLLPRILRTEDGRKLSKELFSLVENYVNDAKGTRAQTLVPTNVQPINRG